MSDQAERLRQKMQEQQTAKSSSKAKTSAIVSGKGGVGKSNISVNFSLSLASKGYKVLLIDFDIGMANIHLLLGTAAEKSIVDYLEDKNLAINDVIVPVSTNLSYIAGGNGLSQIFEMSEDYISRLLFGLEALESDFDYILFDMGAGATSVSLHFLLSVDDIIVISTPEPTSITDAYSMIKFITLKDPNSTRKFSVICNRAESESEGKETMQRLKTASNKFLNIEISALGMLPEDPHVKKSVLKQQPFSLGFPKAPVSLSLETVVRNFLSEEDSRVMTMTKTSFLSRLRNLWIER
ncbi:MinD/ParA family protein [Falsibacillus albus]|uniref:MinD/ParA family protein n=1 Tax=Falsibacillus albus TaxID=2478915 RepID=A0A3L7JY72_9BACI|nr:MinD/ParA family protein [Falsibacillus albus]RLQ95726.1 MinD/ParA family protein [Falsibacillus albus]